MQKDHNQLQIPMFFLLTASKSEHSVYTEALIMQRAFLEMKMANKKPYKQHSCHTINSQIICTFLCSHDKLILYLLILWSWLLIL